MELEETELGAAVSVRADEGALATIAGPHRALYGRWNASQLLSARWTANSFRNQLAVIVLVFILDTLQDEFRAT